jgi:hypothetical protein
MPRHLVVPSVKILERMNMMTEAKQVNLPLDGVTGKIFCGTCHNPHEQGVIIEASNAKGSNHEKRLRDDMICTNCHDIESPKY